MVNPHTSPWNVKNKIPNLIIDSKFKNKVDNIKFHLTTPATFAEYHSMVAINQTIYIAKHKTKFRLKSHLDWAWYTPKTLAHAIDTNTVDAYYEVMLKDIHSDPNDWKDSDFEMKLKGFYAARAGRASLI